MAALGLMAVGLAALLAGAELVTRGGARVASTLGIPPIAIGLTIVSIGTSAPELAVGIEAARDGFGDLAVGNIAGTNVVNLLLILGLSAMIRPVALHARTLRSDVPMMAVAAVAMLVLTMDGSLSRFDGALLLVLAIVYSVIIVRVSRRENVLVRAEYDEELPRPAPRQAVTVVIVQAAALLAGLVIIVFGADWLVNGAVDTARQLGVSDAVIGLTIVAVGTSAPELATALVSTVRNRHRDIAIGNLIGSSVYNIALVLGATALVDARGMQIDSGLVRVDIPVMTVAVLACLPVFVTGRRVSRGEGGVFVLGYAIYLGYLLLART